MRAFASQGATITVLDRDADALARCKEEMPSAVHPVMVDVCDEAVFCGALSEMTGSRHSYQCSARRRRAARLLGPASSRDPPGRKACTCSTSCEHDSHMPPRTQTSILRELELEREIIFEL